MRESFSMIKRVVLKVIFLIGFIYIVWPGPNTVSDFPSLPESVKSNEPGDTRQIPNVVAYFSQSDRAEITNFYKNNFKNMQFLGLIPPISLNYPPQDAKVSVRDELFVTFLEEYSLPLRGSIYVAGYEPYIHNELINSKHSVLSDNIHINGQFFVSKTTLRFYPSPLWYRLIVYFGIWISGMYLYRLYRKVLSND